MHSLKNAQALLGGPGVEKLRELRNGRVRGDADIEPALGLGGNHIQRERLPFVHRHTRPQHRQV